MIGGLTISARFIDVGSIRTRYLHAGSGPPLVLLHGLGVSADVFIRNIAALARAFAVYAVDMVGHGFTDAIDFGTIPPPLHAANHLQALMDTLRISKFSILGQSYGGLVATLVHLARPDAVRQLVIVGSGSLFVHPKPFADALRPVTDRGNAAMSNPDIASCRNRLAAICHDPASVPEEILLSQVTGYALPGKFNSFVATARALTEFSGVMQSHHVYGRLEEITARALVMVGANDARATVETHRAGCTRIRGSRLLVFERCGHMPFIEHPSEFNAALTGFLLGKDIGERPKPG